MTKRLIAIILALAFALCVFAACAEDTPEAPTGSDPVESGSNISDDSVDSSEESQKETEDNTDKRDENDESKESDADTDTSDTDYNGDVELPWLDA